MKSSWFRTLVLCGAWVTAAFAQGRKPFPDGVFAARTIAIVDDTRVPGVSKGAIDALQSWGQFKVVDDPQLADITLRFEKHRNHEGHDSQSKDEKTNDTNYSYTMSFSSSVEMTATFKDADQPFYKTTTEDSKAKAGTACINSFHTAYRDAHAQPKP